jgi:hypothetical protein
MSAQALKQSAAEQERHSINGSDFPYQKTIQHLFMETLCLKTTRDINILPELTKIFPSPSNTSSSSSCSSYGNRIPGDTHFFLSKRFKWGIELLVMGGKDSGGEHTPRFSQSGKYASLNCSDYIVIDFRAGPVSQQVFKHQKKMTVFFSADYKTCSCLHRSFRFDFKPITAATTYSNLFR